MTNAQHIASLEAAILDLLERVQRLEAIQAHRKFAEGVEILRYPDRTETLVET